MSANFLPKVHIDAMLTAALRWSDPEPFRYRQLGSGHMFRLSRDNADPIGTMLWRQNYEATEGWVDSSDPDYIQMPQYQFEELPGDPDAAAARIAQRLSLPWGIENREVFLDAGRGSGEPVVAE